MNASEIKIEDLPEDIRQIAELIGLEACISLIRTYGGEQIYLPKYDSISRKSRDRAIYSARLKKGYDELAHDHNLTVSAVREIIKRERRMNQKEPVQLQLFG